MRSDVISSPLTGPASNITSPLVVRVLFNAIAALLIFTALAKLWLLLTDPFADIKVGMPVSLLWATVVLEISVATLTFSPGVSQRLKWFSLFGIHVLFLIVSVSRFLLGFESCGCAGFDRDSALGDGWTQLDNFDVYLALLAISFSRKSFNILGFFSLGYWYWIWNFNICSFEPGNSSPFSCSSTTIGSCENALA